MQAALLRKVAAVSVVASVVDTVVVVVVVGSAVPEAVAAVPATSAANPVTSPVIALLPSRVNKLEPFVLLPLAPHVTTVDRRATLRVSAKDRRMKTASSAVVPVTSPVTVPRSPWSRSKTVLVLT